MSTEYLVVWEDREEYEDHGYINLGIFSDKQNAIIWVEKQIPIQYPYLKLQKGTKDYWVLEHTHESIHIDAIERLD